MLALLHSLRDRGKAECGRVFAECYTALALGATAGDQLAPPRADIAQLLAQDLDLLLQLDYGVAAFCEGRFQPHVRLVQLGLLYQGEPRSLVVSGLHCGCGLRLPHLYLLGVALEIAL